jgi:hypothetical protein
MKYYVYHWINPKTKEVFYVGKGKYAKCYERAYNKHHAGRCQNKRNKLLNEGFTNEDIVKVIKKFNSENEALQFETEQINLYGIIEEGGTLFNFRKNGTESGSYQKYRNKDILNMIKSYESGATMLEIGEMYNVHETTIRKYLKDYNIKIRRKGVEIRANVEDVIREFKLGVKRIDIAKKYGYTSTSSITRILKLNNIEILSSTKMSQNKIINNKDFIIKSYKDGSTLLDIGRAVKVDPMKISEILQENNVKLVNRS